VEPHPLSLLEYPYQYDTRRQVTRFAQAHVPRINSLGVPRAEVSWGAGKSFRNARRTGTRGSQGRGLWIDGCRVSALEWQASQSQEWESWTYERRGSRRPRIAGGIGGYQRWPGRNLQFGFQGPARVPAWSRVAVDLLGVYTVVDVDDYLRRGPDATTDPVPTFEELDLVLLPNSDPVH
jgi:hypothetical protein